MRLPPLTPDQQRRAALLYAMQPWICTYVFIGPAPGHLCDVPRGLHREAAILANAYISRMMRGDEG